MFRKPQPPGKTTALHDWHRAHGARLEDCQGWTMPSRYRTGVGAEYRAVRTSAGLFDISHLGLIVIRGKKSEQFLSMFLSGNVVSMKEFESRFHLVLNPRGGIIDGVCLYRLPDYWFLSTSPSNDETVQFWLQENSPAFGIEVADVTTEFSLIALQGPSSAEILSAAAGGAGVPEHRMISLLRMGEVISKVSRTGYTGEDGFELLIPRLDTVPVWGNILAAAGKTGKEILPAGMEVREILRFEAGLPAYGKEMNHNITPVEAGLMRYCDLSKNFIGKASLDQQLSEGPKVKLAYIEVLDRDVPGQGAEILDASQTQIGTVAGGVRNPATGKCYCNGFIRAECTQPGTQVGIRMGKRTRQGLIARKPLTHGSRSKR